MFWTYYFRFNARRTRKLIPLYVAAKPSTLFKYQNIDYNATPAMMEKRPCRLLPEGTRGQWLIRLIHLIRRLVGWSIKNEMDVQPQTAQIPTRFSHLTLQQCLTLFFAPCVADCCTQVTCTRCTLFSTVCCKKGNCYFARSWRCLSPAEI